MPIVNKVGGSNAPPLRRGTSPQKNNAETQNSGLALPTEKTKPRTDLRDYTWLIHGEMGVGKTSIASQFEDAFILFFEPGGKGIEAYHRPCPNWKTFKEYIALLKSDPTRFRTIIVDTVDISYKRCFEFVARREGFEHPNDENDFGKSWNKIKDEFSNCLDEIVATGRGLVLISHTEENEFQSRTGSTYKKLIPSMPKQAREYVRGWVDITAYMGYYGRARLLTIQGSDEVDAKCRIKKNFLTVSGERVHSIPMGKDEEEGFKNIQLAFQNKQKTTGEPKEETGMSEVRVIRKPRGAK